MACHGWQQRSLCMLQGWAVPQSASVSSANKACSMRTEQPRVWYCGSKAPRLSQTSCQQSCRSQLQMSTEFTTPPQQALAWFPQEMPRPHLFHASSGDLQPYRAQPCALFLPEKQRLRHINHTHNIATHSMHTANSYIKVRAEQIANLTQSLLLLYAQLRNGSCNKAISSLYIDFCGPFRVFQQIL